VPWDQALAIVLDNNNLACTLSGNVLRIATLETMKIDAEAAERNRSTGACRAQADHHSLSKLWPCKDAVTIIKKFLSIRGRCCGRRTPAMLDRGRYSSTLPKVEELIRCLIARLLRWRLKPAW